MPTPPKPAAKVAAKQFTAWGYTRIQDYTKCPAFAKYKHLDRLPEPEGEALRRGSAIHEQAQVFSQASARAKCPPELQTFEQEFRALQKVAAKRRLFAEAQWAFDKDWEPCEWFGKDAWVRGVVDCHYLYDEGGSRLVKVIDYKTGKVNDAHLGQLSLYALTAMLRYPDADGASVELWYLDHGVLKPDDGKVYLRAEVPALKKEWAAKARPLLADKRFAPKPSKNCTWCTYSRAKGGSCKF
jgi:hypothetical protein